MEIFKAKSLFNSIDNNLIKELVEIDDSLKEKIRKIQLKMLEDLNQLCLENDIKLMLGGGSFLGAIRHKGFIPWDDDIDLMMLRDDFEKLLKVLDNLTKEYEFQYINPQKNSYCTFAKLMYRNSRLIEVGSENIPKLQGVYLDIFIIENIPDKKIVSFFYGLKCNYMQLVSSSIVMAKFPSEYNKKIFMQSFSGKINYFIRKTIGFLYRYQNIEKYFIKVDKTFKKYKDKKTNYVTIQSGRKHYFGEKLPKKIFEEFIEYPFENIKVLGPKDYDVYLKNLYGSNYMQLPPIEKREKHHCIEILIGIDNQER
jgi:lipopolysaccharide biosynthesis protein